MQLSKAVSSAIQLVPYASQSGFGVLHSQKPLLSAGTTAPARHTLVVTGWVKPLIYCAALLFLVAGSGVVRGATEGSAVFDFYGYLDLGPRYSDSSTDGRWAIDSRGSYLGVAGGSNLGSDWRVLFQLEYEIYPDGGDAEKLQRNDVFLGVQTTAGIFRAGVLETPLRHLADPIDLFPDTLGDASELWNGDLRTSNTLYYQAPELPMLPALHKAELAVVLSQGSEEESATANHDGFSAAMWFGDEETGLALAADRHIGGDAVSRQRVAGYWSASMLRFGVAIERESTKLRSSSLAKLVSCAASLSNGYVVKTQYGKSAIQGNDEYLFSLGLDVLLEEEVTIYANVHDHRTSGGANFLSLESGLRFLF